MLSAAAVSAQIEFDKSYRRIAREPQFEGRNLIYISGLNIDYSPKEGQLFSATKTVPWAAYVQHACGTNYILEQDELNQRLRSYSNHNPHVVDMREEMFDYDVDEPKYKTTVFR